MRTKSSSVYESETRIPLKEDVQASFSSHGASRAREGEKASRCDEEKVFFLPAKIEKSARCDRQKKVLGANSSCFLPESPEPSTSMQLSFFDSNSHCDASCNSQEYASTKKQLQYLSCGTDQNDKGRNYSGPAHSALLPFPKDASLQKSVLEKEDFHFNHHLFSSHATHSVSTPSTSVSEISSYSQDLDTPIASHSAQHKENGAGPISPSFFSSVSSPFTSLLTKTNTNPIDDRSRLSASSFVPLKGVALKCQSEIMCTPTALSRAERESDTNENLSTKVLEEFQKMRRNATTNREKKNQIPVQIHFLPRCEIRDTSCSATASRSPTEEKNSSCVSRKENFHRERTGALEHFVTSSWCRTECSSIRDRSSSCCTSESDRNSRSRASNDIGEEFERTYSALLQTQMFHSASSSISTPTEGCKENQGNQLQNRTAFRRSAERKDGSEFSHPPILTALQHRDVHVADLPVAPCPSSIPLWANEKTQHSKIIHFSGRRRNSRGKERPKSEEKTVRDHSYRTSMPSLPHSCFTKTSPLRSKRSLHENSSSFSSIRTNHRHSCAVQQNWLGSDGTPKQETPRNSFHVFHEKSTPPTFHFITHCETVSRGKIEAWQNDRRMLFAGKSKRENEDSFFRSNKELRNSSSSAEIASLFSLAKEKSDFSSLKNAISKNVSSKPIRKSDFSREVEEFEPPLPSLLYLVSSEKVAATRSKGSCGGGLNVKEMKNEGVRPQTSCTDLESSPWDTKVVIGSASGQALQRLFHIEEVDEECALRNDVIGMQTRRRSEVHQDKWQGQECSRGGDLSGHYAVLSSLETSNTARSCSAPSSCYWSSCVDSKAEGPHYFQSDPLTSCSPAPPLLSTPTVRNTCWPGVRASSSSSLHGCTNTMKVAHKEVDKKSLASSSFQDFIERQKSFATNRRKKLQEVEKKLTPLFRPEIQLRNTLRREKTSVTLSSGAYQQQEKEEYRFDQMRAHSMKEERREKKDYLAKPKEVHSSNEDRSLCFELERKALFSASEALSTSPPSFTPLNPQIKETLKNTCHKNSRKEQETKVPCTFHPSISSFAQRLPSRGNCFEYLYKQSSRRSELQREAQKALHLKESIQFPFQPTLNCNRSKKSVFHASNYSNLKEMQRQREDFLRSQREELQRKKDKEELQECTFQPKTTKIPFFVQQMAEEYAMIKGKSAEPERRWS